MKPWATLAILVLAGNWAVPVVQGGEAVRLTSLQRVQGWRLLFDGVSLDDWRGYRMRKTPAEWQVADGELRSRGGVGLVTDEEFKDFELEFEWMIGEGGTGAVYFRVSEEGATPGETGPVMELATKEGQTGGNGGLTARQVVRGVRVGDWYRAKLVVFGSRVEHWVDGQCVLTYMLADREWHAARSASRYRTSPDYGILPSGRIVLEGAGIVFRHIKIKPL